MKAAAPTSTPWYCQGWPWLLIALPATAVIAGFVTLWLAIRSPEAVVVDDYYKAGLAINVDQSRSQRAHALGLEGRLSIDTEANRLDLHLSSTTHALLPETVTLRLLHATRAHIDVTMNIRRTAEGEYTASLSPLSAGHWYVQVLGTDWRLDGEIRESQHNPAVSLAPSE